MDKCEYGCGNNSVYVMKNGKKCCSTRYNKCPAVRKRMSESIKNAWTDDRKKQYSKNMTEQWKDPESVFNSEEWRRKNSDSLKSLWKDPESVFNSKEHRKLRSKLNKGSGNPMFGKRNGYTLEYLKKKHQFFCKVEEVKEADEKINVKCKKCKKWFIPSGSQLSERIRQLEQEDGNGRSYLYCSDECKGNCEIYNVKYTEMLERDNTKYYTQAEYKVFREYVLKRDDYICQYCGEVASDVHHERPQKKEPFFSLDPDYGWSCCEKCHYQKGHKVDSECSTGVLSTIICQEK